MARLTSIGLELNSLTANVEVTSTSVAGGGAVAIDATIKRSGLYSFHSSNAGANGRAIFNYNFVAADTSNKHFFRMYMYVVDLPSAVATILNVEALAGTDRGKIRITTSGTLFLENAIGTQIGSASAALNLNQWYRVEMMIFNNTTSGKTELEFQLGGTSIASTTTDANTGTYGNVAIGITSSVTSYDIYFDDIAINDTSGSNQTSWCGEGKIIRLTPNAAGDANSRLNTAGGAGDANNYTLCDEETPNDATDYTQTNLLNSEDLFNCAASGIGASDTVNVVHIGGRFANNTADAVTSFRFEVIKTSGGTKSQSASIIPNSTTWKTNAIAAPINYPLTLYADPDSSAWTQATLDTAQIGMIDSAINVNKILVSTVWMLVDYTVVAAASGVNRVGLLTMVGVGN